MFDIEIKTINESVESNNSTIANEAGTTNERSASTAPKNTNSAGATDEHCANADVANASPTGGTDEHPAGNNASPAGENIAVLIHGMIDSTTSEQFATSMERVLLEKPHSITLDFADVDYISSAGFRVLFMIAKEMKKNNGALCAVNVSEEIKNLLTMVHMERVMDIEGRMAS